MAVPPPRAIAHIDLDAFFCSVEILQDPALKDKPLVVGGRPEERGVVAAASYPAREFGIHSAMSMYQALKRCPELIVKPPRFKAYRTYSRIVMGVLRSACPLIQQVSVDEAYLDFTERIRRWDEAPEIAGRLQRKIARDIGLSASVGVGTSKMIAKIASDYEKPAGFTVVPPGRERAFLALLPVEKIPGIGPKTAAKLARMQVVTVQDLAGLSETALSKAFGKWGHEMYRWARGIDERPVHEEEEAKSISTERTFSEDIADEQRLLAILDELSARVAGQLQREGQRGRTIAIKVRYADFVTFTRQLSLGGPTAAAERIGRAVRELFLRAWTGKRPVRLLGVGVSNFAHREQQLELNI